MITDLFTHLRDFGDLICAVFMLPGDLLLSQLADRLPAIALTLGVGADDDSLILPAIAALLSWICVGIVVWAIVRLCQNIARIIGAAVRTMSFRTTDAAGNFKTWIVCKIRQLLPRRRSEIAESADEVDFDDLDMAVLRSAAACGPGFATSAPELAEQLMLRPAQIQKSLDRLHNKHLLDTVLGSTDGFDNYRLTKSGAFFIAAWRRKWRQAR